MRSTRRSGLSTTRYMPTVKRWSEAVGRAELFKADYDPRQFMMLLDGDIDSRQVQKGFQPTARRLSHANATPFPACRAQICLLRKIAFRSRLRGSGLMVLRKMGSRAMAMGDLVLSESEVKPVMLKLRWVGIEQTALLLRSLEQTLPD
jgi:hypothetical protein